MAPDCKKTDEEIVEAGEWLIRPCQLYFSEYKDCRSFGARFHQYYVHGEMIDCSQWKRDYDTCKKWIKEKDVKAAADLITSERTRRSERLGPHVKNNTWERRSDPPEDWNKPLPPHMQEEYEATYLNIKSKEMKGEPTGVISDEGNFCVIM